MWFFDNYDYVTFFNNKILTESKIYIDARYVFTYSKKEHYNDIYMSFTNVNFCNPIIWNNSQIPANYTYKLMIVNKCTRNIWILNNNYKVIFNVMHNDAGNPVLYLYYNNSCANKIINIDMMYIIDEWKDIEARSLYCCRYRKIDCLNN